MSDALNISRGEAEIIAMFGGLLERWFKMANDGTLRTNHIDGMRDSKGNKTQHSLDDVGDYMSMASPAIQEMFEYHEGAIWGRRLRQSAEVLSGIQRRVDLCREGIKKDGDISFTAYVRLVHGDECAPKNSVLRKALDVAVRNYGGPAAFNTTEDELQSFKTATNKYARTASKRVSADKDTEFIMNRMLETGDLQQEMNLWETAQVSGGQNDLVN